MDRSIQITDIQKSYGNIQALKGINLNISSGELFGLIGPDGAGKTTLIRILTTLLLADKGQASLMGLDVVKHYKTIRKQIGYMPGRFSLYFDLSIEENLSLFATIFGTTISKNYDLIRDIYVQIEPFKKRRAGKLSGGMKQKLALCCALIHAPGILILDEPTTGVDAVSRKEFWDMLHRLKQRGITILVSTPYMDEASQCDRVALIQNGDIMQVDRPQGIMDRFKPMLYSVRGKHMYQLLRDLRNYEHSRSVHAFGDRIHYTDQRGEIEPDSLVDYLAQQGHEGIRVQSIQAGIEDCFMELMGNTV